MDYIEPPIHNMSASCNQCIPPQLNLVYDEFPILEQPLLVQAYLQDVFNIKVCEYLHVCMWRSQPPLGIGW